MPNCCFSRSFQVTVALNLFVLIQWPQAAVSQMDLQNLVITGLEVLPDTSSLMCTLQWAKGCSGTVLQDRTTLDALVWRYNGERVREGKRIGVVDQCHPVLRLTPLPGPGEYSCAVQDRDGRVWTQRQITVQPAGGGGGGGGYDAPGLDSDKLNSSTVHQKSGNKDFERKDLLSPAYSSTLVALAILVPLALVITGTGLPVGLIAVCCVRKRRQRNDSSRANEEPNDACSIGSEAVYIEPPGIEMVHTYHQHEVTPRQQPTPPANHYEVPAVTLPNDLIPMSQPRSYEVPGLPSIAYRHPGPSRQSISEEAVAGYLTIVA